jgi:hypothetical protein
MWPERGGKLTTHLHLVPRSKNAWSCTSTPPVHLHVVLVMIGFTDRLFSDVSVTESSIVADDKRMNVKIWVKSKVIQKGEK